MSGIIAWLIASGALTEKSEDRAILIGIDASPIVLEASEVKPVILVGPSEELAELEAAKLQPAVLVGPSMEPVELIGS